MSTNKNAQPYYPHNANARNEDNIIRLRMAHGVAGYGVYHMLLERLRMSDGYKCELDYDILSWDLACEAELIRSVIYDFGLFEIVDDGQMFSSVELNSYMRYMEEKAAERKAKAQAAANARWGNNQSASKDSQPQLPLDIEDAEPANATDCLDKEIETIKTDNDWLDHMAKESGKTQEEIISFLDDFRTTCILKGIKNGHKDMTDAFSHFRGWIYKSGRAKDPNSKRIGRPSGDNDTRYKNPGHLIMDRLNRQAEERAAKWNENERKKADPQIYIRNKGYDPAEVTIVQLMQPNWQKNNPPTHPEWIGKFFESQPELAELPY